jgi:cell filamentation protein
MDGGVSPRPPDKGSPRDRSGPCGCGDLPRPGARSTGRTSRYRQAADARAATEQHYRVTLSKAREELEPYLPAARQQAADRLHALVREEAPSAAIAHARTELAYVRHPKGPVYQSNLLTYLGIRQVDAVIGPKQTPLERVREIGAALGVQINAQQPSQLQRAVRSLERPLLPQGHSPGQERLAALFLRNAPEKNLADPRLAPAQTIVDTAMQLARDRGDSARSVAAQGEAARQRIADSIRTGETLDAGVSGRAQYNKPLPPARDKGPNRRAGRGGFNARWSAGLRPACSSARYPLR